MPGRGQIRTLTGKKFGRLKVSCKFEQREVGKEKDRVRRKTFWLCECKCGNKKWVSRDGLVSGHTTSCGCYSKEVRTRPLGAAAKTKLYGRYRQDAKKRNLNFDISEEDFLLIVANPCRYCGRSNVGNYKPKGCNGNFRYTGVDRIDSSQGYILGNCQPCCVDCNRAKWELSHKQFVRHIVRIYKHQEKSCLRNILAT